MQVPSPGCPGFMQIILEALNQILLIFKTSTRNTNHRCMHSSQRWEQLLSMCSAAASSKGYYSCWQGCTTLLAAPMQFLLTNSLLS